MKTARLVASRLVPNRVESPYLRFSRQAWSGLRQDAPGPLTEDELCGLRGIHSPTTVSEVEEIYLPLARLLGMYFDTSQALYQTTARFLGAGAKVPYIIGVAGSVAVGKSTTSRILQTLLSRWHKGIEVELVTTDGYLFPNAVLVEMGMLNRKGFPESYDVRNLVNFLSDLKSGKTNLRVPLYSHARYDVLQNEYKSINRPQIVIVEGLNLLQSNRSQGKDDPHVFVSDFLDFSIYLDAPMPIIKQWYIKRFMYFREKAQGDSSLFFHRFSLLTDEEALRFAEGIWEDINEINLKQNILPFRERAQLILKKIDDHSIQEVLLRKT